MSVSDSVTAELTELSVLDSTDGQIAVALAAALDDRAGVVNLSSTAKVLTELMKTIRSSTVPAEGSMSDDLRARRSARRGLSAS